MPYLLRSVVFMGVVLIVVLGLFGFFQSPFFRVTELEVRGLVLVQGEEVRAVMDLHGEQHMYSFSLGEMEERIAADPRIAEVSITRHLPGRVVVQVREHRPVAVIARGGVFALLNQDGKVLAVESSWPGLDLPVLAEVAVPDLTLGEQVDAAEVDELLECALLLDELRHRISQMMREEGYISLYTTETAHVLFPVDEDDARMAAEVLINMVDEGRLMSGTVVDLRVPERPVIRHSGAQ